MSTTEPMRALPLILLVACGSSQSEPVSAPVASVSNVDEPQPVTYEPPVTAGTIHRTQLVAVLDAGLGRFLQGVDTEPDLREGDFVGFRLRRLYPADERFTALDLQPGDTVIAINGQSIERPEHALQVWESLRVASQLLVEYLRQDERRQLRFEIID